MPRTTRSATTTTDHDEIRKWVEERGGTPAAVERKTRGDAGILRIDFPGFSGANLRHISWDDWFKTFDETGLAFLHRDKDRFNKLVRREEKEERARPRARAGRRAAASKRGEATAAKGSRAKSATKARSATKSKAKSGAKSAAKSAAKPATTGKRGAGRGR